LFDIIDARCILEDYEDDRQGSLRRNDNTLSDVTGHHPAPKVAR